MADDESVRSPQKPDYDELGVSGTRILAGIPYEETIPALQGLNAYKTYSAMRFDPTCAALLKAREQPVRSARHFIQPASDAPADLEKADFIHDNLFELGSQSMDDILRLAMGKNTYGFTPMEVCYFPITEGPWRGKVGWDKFAWRNPVTKWRWNMGEVDGRQELVSMTQLAPPYYSQVDIPRNKLLLFVNEHEGDNYDGWSMLRYAYKPYFIREGLYKVQAIGLERAYVGVPKVTLPENFSDEMKKLALQIAQSVRSDDNAGITHPADLLVDILRTELGAGREMQEAIQHHTREILKSGLAQFLELGAQGAAGSWALSNDHSELFLMAVNADANYLDEVINLDPGIPALLRFNFADFSIASLPRKTHGDIGQENLEALGRTLMALGKFGFLTPDDATEDTLRARLDFPERDDTVTERALQSLTTIPFPAVREAGREHTKPRPEVIAGQPVDESGASGSTPDDAAQMAMSEYRQAVIRKPWDRPRGRLSDEDRVRIRLTERLAENLEAFKADPSWRPPRPSVVAARMRRPYVLRTTLAEQPTKIERAVRAHAFAGAYRGAMLGGILEPETVERRVFSEDRVAATIARVTQEARDGELKPVKRPASASDGGRKVIPKHQLTARKHAQDIKRFFEGLDGGDVPKG